MRVKGVGPPDAKLMCIGMAPEKHEVELNTPFVGTSGKILRDALRAGGIPPEKCFITNVSEEFLPSGTSLFSIPKEKLDKEILRLKGEIEKVNPNCILALGDEPLQIITKMQGVTKYAGSILPSTLVPEKKVVACMHPSWIVRGMWKWLTVFQEVYVKRAIKESIFPELNLPTRRALIGPSLNQAIQYIERGIDLALDPDSYLSFDIETMYWKKDRMGHIACVGIGYSPDEAMCIPFILGNGKSYWSVQEESLIWELLARLLQSPIRKIAQNASFEWIYFWMHGIYPSNLFIDTMLLHHMLYPDFGGVEDEMRKKNNPGNPGHSLRFINSHYTRTPYYKDDGRNWSKKLGSIENLWRYNCTDVTVTAECAEKMWNDAHEVNLQEFYVDYYIRPFYHAVRMEWDGVLQDIVLRKQLLEETSKEIDDLKNEIQQAIGHEININSGPQMQNFLYKERGYQLKTNRKTKQITADKNAIEFFANKYDDKALKLILTLRKKEDFRSDILLQKLDDEGFIHTHYKLGGTDGARWSSTKSILGNGTNLQNIPRDGPARKLFLP